VSVPAPANNPPLLRFGPFQLDLRACELRKGETLLHLAPQPCKVLALLASRPQKVFTRQEIQQEIWGGETFVDFDQGLNAAIRQIRTALCDDAETPRYIETLPKRGYRFIGQIDGHSAVAEGATTAVLAESAALSAPTVLRPLAYRRPLTVLVGLAFAAAVAVFVWRMERGPRRTPLARIQSVAVLPLENLSHDAEQEYFADGMTDALITDLAKIHALRVISRNSIMQYKGNRKPMPQIARELNVDAIVEGTVMRSGDHVRITAQLIEGPMDRHLWAETYERDLRDILALQDEVAKAIATEVKITLTPQEQSRLSNARQVDTAANEACLRGLYQLHGMTAEPTATLKSQSLEKAIAYFQQALANDPNDALAYSGLADAYSNLSTHYRAPLEVLPKAKAAATRAIELDDTLAEAHASLGYVALIFDWDWARAEHEFRRALELNPSSPRAHAGYAEYLLFVDHRTDEGLEELQRAYALDPLLPLSHGDRAWLLFLARRYTESIEAAHRVGHDDHILALCYAELGQAEQALAAADRAVKSTQNPVILSQVAAAYALAGRKDKARAMISGIEGQARARYVCGFNVACLYSVLGDKDQAFAWLEKAHRDRSD
jgi:TolB-like protein/DNA-binding winged helix-turn-helix (wHTH) protein/Flp pilus assembly protein TadD